VELFGVDIQSLAVFRISAALLIFYDLITRLPDIQAFYSDQGVLPRFFLFQQVHFIAPSAYFMTGSVFGVLILFLFTGLSAVALLVGWHTRPATFAAWFLSMSLQLRNPYVLNAGDQVLCLVLFWEMFLPLGQAYSVDAIVRPLEAAPAPRSVFSVGTVAFLGQVSMIYLFTFILKFDNS